MNKFKFIAEEKLQKPKKVKKKKADVVREMMSEEHELTCSHCGETNTTVSMRADPYNSEINGDDSEMLLCDSCVDSARQDI